MGMKQLIPGGMTHTAHRFGLGGQPKGQADHHYKQPANALVHKQIVR